MNCSTSCQSVAKKTNDLSAVQERENEYYGSNLTDIHGFGLKRSIASKNISKEGHGTYKFQSTDQLP